MHTPETCQALDCANTAGQHHTTAPRFPVDFTHTICETCGTGVVEDPESGAQAHVNRAYSKCGVEGELAPLVDHVEGRGKQPRRHLRLT